MVDCHLTKILDLDFDYRFGGCRTYQSSILFCFPDVGDGRACHS